MRFKKGSKVEIMNKEAPSSWYDVEKASRKFIRPSAKHSLKMRIQEEEEEDNDVRLQKSHHVVSRNRKRASPFHSSVHESCQKVKKVKPAEIHKKVDAFVGNQYIQASINTSLKNGSCSYYEMEKRKTTNGVSRISQQFNDDDDDDDDSDQCSVGSCSVVVPSGTAESDDDVASFVDTSSDEEDDDDVAVSIHIHRLELHAYRSTLEALYASGPLSWEKEALLTNLRINLHISNDEHLTELRHLISSGVN